MCSSAVVNSSICFGDDSTPAPLKSSSRVNRPGGTGGESSVFSDDPVPERFTSRVIQPGGTGGKSSVFEEEPSTQPRSNRPVQPSPLVDDGAPVQERVHTRVAQPGGTGGQSHVFDDAPIDAPKHISGERAPAPFAREGENAPAETVSMSTRVLQPGGTGGHSKVFSDDVEEELVRSTRRINVNELSSNRLEDDEERRLAARKVFAQQRAGGGPSKVFGGGDEEEENSNKTISGRKVEPGRTNKSQVALGGGYPDAEPAKRTGRRGNIRSDYNSSQISFGDDTKGEPVAPKDANRTSSKVLRPGGTGGSSQIQFGDDTNGQEVDHPPSGTRTSSRVLKPGGTGGSSQITF